MIESDEDIIRILGSAHLKTIPESHLQPLRIASSSKIFLNRIGLPTLEIRDCVFDLSGRPWPTLDAHTMEQGVAVHDMSHLRRIGTQMEIAHICLDENRNGEVWNIVPDEPELDCLINTRIETFVRGLALISLYRRDMSGLPEAEVETVGHRYADLFLQLEPGIEPESWWGIAAEQARIGYL